jgi:type IV pilus assembly protein PilC
MAHYKYIARDANGKKVSGSQEAPQANDLLDRLTRKGYVVTKIEPVEDAGKPAGIIGALSSISFGGGKVSQEQMIYFNLQLSNMLEAGMTLLSALENIIFQVKNKTFRSILKQVTSGIEEGKSLSESAGRFPKVFPELFTSLLYVGESSGTLDVILNRYSRLIEDQYELKKKVKSAMTYPIILVIVSIGIVALMMTLVVPNFVKIFMKTGVPLPWPTQFLYNLSQAITKNWIILVVVCILIFVVVRFLKATPWGRRKWDVMKLRLPLFGSLNRRVVMTRWARTLGTMVAGGVPILQALVISKKVAQNELIERGIGDACAAVERGGRIGESFRENKEFPIEVVQMISVGEESGTLDKMLLKVADFYDKLIAYQVKRLSELIEPAFLIFVGTVVGFIMLSVMLPIFDMLKALQGRGM